MNCPNCNAPINPKDKFCGSCGKPFIIKKKQKPPVRTTQVASKVDPAQLQKDAQKNPPPKVQKQAPQGTIAQPQAQTLEIKPGVLFANRYKIIKEIGRGGMGAIYKAQDIKLKESVALKLLLPGLQANPQVIERFIHEIKLSLKITHENVVRIYDIGEVGRIHFISMEYIEGIDLKQLIKTRAPFTEEIGIKIINQICFGLSAAHKKGITHRDVKPQNVLIGADGSVKIVDFGIAKIDTTDGMTREGVVIGTPEYMSPEQALAKKIDYRTDIYSIGAMMYECFSGRIPFNADTPLGIALKHVNELPTPPTMYNANLPEYMEAIILKAMEKNPDDRFQDIEEIPHAIEQRQLTVTQLKIDDATESVDEDAPTNMENMDTETLFQKGMSLYEQYKYREALNYFESVLKKEPDHDRAYDYLEMAGEQIAREANVSRLLNEGEKAFQMNDFQTALQHFEEASKYAENNPEVQIALRKTRAAASSTFQGTQTIESNAPAPVVQQQTGAKDVKSMFQEAEELYQQKKYVEAIELFQEILSIDPNHHQSFELLEIAKGAKATLDEIEHHFLTAKRLVEDDDFDGARNELEIVLDYNPDHEAARKLLDEIESRAGSSGHKSRGPSADYGEVELEEENVEEEPKDPLFLEKIEAAKALVQEDKLAEAIDLLKEAEIAFPDYPETAQYIDKIEIEKKKREIDAEIQPLLGVAKEHFQMQRYRQSMTIFRRILAIDSENSEAKEWLAKAQKELKSQNALDDSQRIRVPIKDGFTMKDSEPQQPPFYVRFMPHLIGAGALLLIIISLLVVFVFYPEYQAKKLADYKTQGLLFLSQGRYKNAVEVLEKALAMEYSIETLEKLGRAYFYSESYLRALDVYQNILKDKPNDPQYHYMLGMIHEKNKERWKAIESYQKVIELNEKNYEAYAALAFLFYDNGEFEKAINYATISLEMKSSQPKLRHKLAQTYQELGQVDQAELEYQKVLEIEGTNIDAGIELAKLYISRENFDLARQTLDFILSRTKGNATVYFLLGTIYDAKAGKTSGREKVEQQTKAVENYKQCLMKEPSQVEAMMRLAKVYIAMNEIDKAEGVFKQHLELFPDDATVNFELGVIYHRRKNAKLAMWHYKKALAVDSQNAKIWANLGSVYVNLGNYKEAVRHFEKSLDLEPDQPLIKDYLEKLKKKVSP